MAQFDDVIGSIMKQLDKMRAADNTIIVVTTDNGTETLEGGSRVPAIIRRPGKAKPNQAVTLAPNWHPEPEPVAQTTPCR